MAEPGDQSYRAGLGRVLRSRDPNALHLFLRQQAATFGDESQVEEIEQRSHQEMEELLHRMILTRPDLADLHAESRAWLTAHGAEQPPRPRQRARAPRTGSKGPGDPGRRPPRD